MVGEPMSTEPEDARRLRRLEQLMDVVFALAIWRVFTNLPIPDPDQPEWNTVLEMLYGQWPRFAGALIGIAILIVFWLQNNNFLSKLKGTDPVHAGLALIQMFFILLLLYAIEIEMRNGSAYDTRVLQSVAALLVGIFSYLAWLTATRRGLVADQVGETAISATSQKNLAEPLTALSTIPFAFVGPIIWELSWFVYPMIRRLLKK